VNDTERRKHARYLYQIPIMYCHYFENPYCFYGAHMENCSPDGMYFISKYEIEPGTVIFIKNAYSDTGSSLQITEVFHWARVVWCKKIQDSAEVDYGVGITNIDSIFDSTEQKEKLVSDVHVQKKTASTGDAVDPLKVLCENPACQTTQLELRYAKEIAESRAQKLEILYHFAQAIGSTLDPERILKIICKEMVRIFGARNTGIGLLKWTPKTVMGTSLGTRSFMRYLKSRLSLQGRWSTR